jgi:ATP-dependent Clp protease adaptor protein ClpS
MKEDTVSIVLEHYLQGLLQDTTVRAPLKLSLPDNQAAIAVAEPPAAAPPEERSAPRKPKKLPPHAVVVLNDDLHTFNYVIETFMKVFGYPKEKCFQLAMQIHVQGRAIVWSGPKEVAELKCDQIRGAGPDFYAAKKVEFPLGVLVEPLPG